MFEESRAFLDGRDLSLACAPLFTVSLLVCALAKNIRGEFGGLRSSSSIVIIASHLSATSSPLLQLYQLRIVI
eukprot:scaffold1893_cov220-Amphora_coffeaeformis.AAC.30